MTDGTIDGAGDVVTESRPDAEEPYGGTGTEMLADVDRRARAGAAVDLLEGETPAEIIDRADEPDPAPEPSADLLPDQAELEDVLLPDRRSEDEFLWVVADAVPESREEDATPAPRGEEGADSTSEDRVAIDVEADEDPTEPTDDPASADENEAARSSLLGRVRSWLPR